MRGPANLLTILPNVWETVVFVLEAEPRLMTLQQVIYERPPEGMSRGRFPAPWWVIALVAALIVIAAVIFLVARWVSARRLARGPAEPPTS